MAMTFRKFVRWSSNSGYSRKEIFAMARLWWRVHPEDRGDNGVFEIIYHGKRLTKEFYSRRAGIEWALWNYKGSHTGWVVRPVSLEHLDEPDPHCPLCSAGNQS
jgi:hypothetical protein